MQGNQDEDFSYRDFKQKQIDNRKGKSGVEALSSIEFYFQFREHAIAKQKCPSERDGLALCLQHHYGSNVLEVDEYKKQAVIAVVRDSDMCLTLSR